MRYAFAGDRDIAVRILEFLLEQGERPSALLIPENASHGVDLQRLLSSGAAVSGKSDDPLGDAEPDSLPVFAGRDLGRWKDELQALDLDYVIGIHYPHLVPREILAVPRVGVLNLHPAYLPFNRGWHTPSWSILEGTPAGATLHFMADTLDAGDIIHQKTLKVCPSDTAHTLYRRLKDLEYEVFVEAWPDLLRGEPQRTPQSTSEGSSHRRADLAEVRQIDLDAPTTARNVLRQLRALTTDRLSEAAFYEEDERRFLVRVEITEE